MRTLLVSLVASVFLLAGCTSQNRQDTVPETFTVKNNSTTAVAVLLFSGRTHSIGSLPPTLNDLDFSQHQVNPGVSRENVPAAGFIDGDSVYLQVYAVNGGVNGLVHSKLYNTIELIRNRKLLVYQGP